MISFLALMAALIGAPVAQTATVPTACARSNALVLYLPNATVPRVVLAKGSGYCSNGRARITVGLYDNGRLVASGQCTTTGAGKECFVSTTQIALRRGARYTGAVGVQALSAN